MNPFINTVIGCGQENEWVRGITSVPQAPRNPGMSTDVLNALDTAHKIEIIAKALMSKISGSNPEQTASKLGQPISFSTALGDLLGTLYNIESILLSVSDSMGTF
jgi:hypothetical protein